jgi:hypothetical protein
LIPFCLGILTWFRLLLLVGCGVGSRWGRARPRRTRTSPRRRVFGED